MHKTRRKDGRIYVALVEGYRKDGKSKMKTVESLGYLDELEKEFDDPIAHFKALCDEANSAAKLQRQDVQITIHPQQKIDKRQVTRKNIGSTVLLAAYDALGVETVIRNATRGSKASYDVNAVMKLLVAERIFDPGSKKSAWENKERYFFRTEFSP